MRLHAFTLLSLLGLVPSLVNASLSGSVGPLTSASAKAAKKTCNVLDYGAKADQKTDLGPPLAAAFAACKSGGLVYIPAGNYAMSTWVKLADGKAWALQIDGVIYRTGTGGGNMIMIERASDFELFSSTSSGAMQGLGYEFHVDNNWSGPRLLRLWDVSDFSVHDLILVDSPSFHFSLDTCSNGEVYNMAVRGGNHGGLDGIDVWSTNIWIHDVEVTNKDECVTVKVCSSDINILVCLIKNIYTWKSNNMMLIKSNGGSGTVSNVVFENFIGHGNAYSLDIDSYWSSMSAVAGNGVELSNITVKNWKGTEENGAQRGPIKIICPDKAPCYDIFIEDFAMWTESGSKQWYSCESAYGSGFCLKSGSQHTSYAVTTTTVSSAPSGYSAAKMPLDLTTDFGITKSIPIPTIPTTFYPGATPYSALKSKQSTKAAKARAVDLSIETPAAAFPSDQEVQGASQETGQASPESAGPVPSGTPGPVPTGGNRPSGHHHGHHHSHHPHHSRTAA